MESVRPCSAQHGEHMRTTVGRVCIVCATDFQARQGDVKRGFGTCCSRACASKRGVTSPNRKTQEGSANGNWRGGVSQNKSAYRKRYQQKYPEKAKAHRWVADKISRGVITRQPCCRCGSENDVHAHHDEYSKPDQIMWLCRLHHRERHVEIGKPMGHKGAPVKRWA